MNKKLKSVAIALVAGGLIGALGVVTSVDVSDPTLSAKAVVGGVLSAFVTGVGRAAQLMAPAVIETLRGLMAPPAE